MESEPPNHSNLDILHDNQENIIENDEEVEGDNDDKVLANNQRNNFDSQKGQFLYSEWDFPLAVNFIEEK